MIKSIEIKFAMSDQWSHHTLRHELNKYTDICASEVIDIISKGVDGYLEKLVAFVLGLKKYIPAGFIPERRVLPQKTQQLNLPISATNQDRVIADMVRGVDHGNYKHGGYSIGPEKSTSLKTKTRKYPQINNVRRLKAIVDICGGWAAMSIITGVSERTVQHWHKQTRRGTRGFFPQKYIYKISKFTKDYNLNITRDELESLLPPKYEDYL